jgi:hypothetical protein
MDWPHAAPFQAMPGPVHHGLRRELHQEQKVVGQIQFRRMSFAEILRSTSAGFHGNRRMYPPKSNSGGCSLQKSCKVHRLELDLGGYIGWFPWKPADVVCKISANYMCWKLRQTTCRSISGPGGGEIGWFPWKPADVYDLESTGTSNTLILETCD